VQVHDSGIGVEKRAVSVSFGDGASARGRTSFRHRYAHGGIYTIVVHVRDRLGNSAIVRRLVSVQ
jgi:hypothetical protein